MALSVRVVDSVTGFAALRPAWDALVDRGRTPTVFSTFEWNWTAWDYRCSSTRPFILQVLDENEVVGLLPLRSLDANVHTTLVPISMGYRSLAEYIDLISAPGYKEAALEEALGFLARQPGWTLLEWPEISEASPSFVALGRAARRAGLRVVLSPGSVCRRVNLPASWGDYVARLSPSMREFERRERKLCREHGASFQRVTEEAGIAPALDAVQAMQERRWTGGARSQDLEAFLGFVRRVAPLMLRRGWLDLEVLRVAGAPVAVNCDFRFRDTVYGYLGAFDPDRRWAKYGVGTLLTARGMRWAIEDGLRAFDLSRGDDAYKARWATVTRRNYRARVVRTRAHAAYYRCREFARRVKSALRPTRRPAPHGLRPAAASLVWCLEPLCTSLEWLAVI
jgi:CelD/BcsL family acetyltransferase involved in cellulose biosynthesis